jgi:hypothetical protein
MYLSYKRSIVRLVLLGHAAARCVRLVATLKPRGNHELGLIVVSEHESSADA